MNDLDLFGDPLVMTIKGSGGGYAGDPGSGPDGFFCRDCDSYQSVQHGRRRYPKCALVKRTCGPGTDIKASAPCCHRFNQRKVTEEKTHD